MSLTAEQYQTMCAFFDGELSHKEERIFLAQVAADAELNREFEWEEKMMYGTVPQRSEELAIAADSGIAAWQPAVPETKSQGTPLIIWLRKWRFQVAACLVIGFLTALLLINKQGKDKKNEIAVKPTIPVKNMGKKIEILKDSNKAVNIPEKVKRGDSIPPVENRKPPVPVAPMNEAAINRHFPPHEPDIAEEPAQFGIVQNEFAKEDYTAALAASNEVPETRGGNDEEKRVLAYTHFYKGLSLIELNRNKEGLAYLAKVMPLKKEFAQLADEANWFSTKAYLKMKNSGKAIEILQQLSAPNSKSAYKKRATAVLKKLMS
jgi:hypothetical protein